MNTTNFHKKIPLKWWAGLTVAVLFAIFMNGLKPKDISPPNHVAWLTARTGLRFEKYGIAYTDSISDLIQVHGIVRNTFSIEIALKAKDFSEEGFHFILLLHGGRDGSQLLIGQWRSSLIVMNGDDYDHHRKTDRIMVTSSDEQPQIQFVTITTGSGGTGVYLNGQLAGSKKEMRLEIPDGKNTQLVLGNSVYGNYPWEGELYGIAIYGETLSEKEVSTHYKGWATNLDFSFVATSSPFLLYNLDNNGTNLAAFDTRTAKSLQIPSRLKILTPNFFYQKLSFRRVGKSLFKDRDAALNFFGFIPLGLLLGATLIKLGGKFENHCVGITLAAGFFVSLWIETVQAWMPARSSDVQDLILNTTGTFVGVLCCRVLLFKGKGEKSQGT